MNPISALALLALSTTQDPAAVDNPAPSPQTPTEVLEAVIADEWEDRLAANPLLASSVGRDEYSGSLPDVSPVALARRAAIAGEFIRRLKEIDPNALGAQDRVSRSMLYEQLEDRVASIAFHEYETPLNADSGFHTGFARLADEVELKTEDDARAFVARMRAFPEYVDQQIANMQAGIESGRVLPRVVMLGFVGQLRPMLAPAESHPFTRAFERLPEEMDAEVRAQWIAAGHKATEEAIIPAYKKFRTFLEGTYIPAGRRTLGAKELPNGDAYYAFLVRRYTTLDQTPKQVHERGLSEVARIRADMEALVEDVGFDGSFAEFLEYLRTDDRFYAKSPDELLTAAREICKRIDGRLPRYFGLLPRQPYGVEPVPPAIAPKYTSGRYVRAPLGSTRSGTYWVNTFELSSRPMYALPALSLHEAMPGHHLQIALTAELDHLPPFRRTAYVTAFGEGWALYTEWLGIEMGIYRDPYEEFGRLTYEMWRAARLVVDTGLHAFNWTRQEAIDYLSSNTALSIHECTTETDRYISWPGQALAYKTGELEIRALRKRAEETLGADFDVREFHDAILANGSVPMSVLREHMHAWMER